MPRYILLGSLEYNNPSAPLPPPPPPPPPPCMQPCSPSHPPSPVVGLVYVRIVCSIKLTQVKAEYMTPIEETVKYLIVRGFFLSKVRAVDFSGIPLRTKTLCLRRRKRKDGTEEKVYEPEVLDLSKVSTPVKLLAMAEMIAEDAHDRWASSLKKTSRTFQHQTLYTSD